MFTEFSKVTVRTASVCSAAGYTAIAARDSSSVNSQRIFQPGLYSYGAVVWSVEFRTVLSYVHLGGFRDVARGFIIDG